MGSAALALETAETDETVTSSKALAWLSVADRDIQRAQFCAR